MSQATLMPKPPVVSASPEEFKNSRESRRYGLFAPHLMKAAFVQSFVMLRPDIQWKNPVMFVVEVGTVLSIIFTFIAPAAQLAYLIQLDIWLFATVVFANFATALAEARGKAQADSLRKTRQRDARVPHLLKQRARRKRAASTALARPATASRSKRGRSFLGDGGIVEGVASVDESAITGESAPVISCSRRRPLRASPAGRADPVRPDRRQDHRQPREPPFLDRMISLVEGAIRQRTPNEIALSLVLSAFTLIFLIVTAALWPMALNAEIYMQASPYLNGATAIKSLGTDVPTLVGLLVCLIPTTIGAPWPPSASPVWTGPPRANILSKSGKAVEVAGDVDTLLLDKTGTITVGNRRATQFVPINGYTAEDLGRLASWASVPRPNWKARALLSYISRCRSNWASIVWPATSAARRRVSRGGQIHRIHGTDPHERRRSARRPADSQGSPRLDDGIRRAQRRYGGRSRAATGGRRRLARCDAAAGLRRQQARRVGRAGRHSETGDARSVRTSRSRMESADGDGDGGQPTYRQGNCRASRCRRVHRIATP